MPYLFWGAVILFSATALFYAIMFSLIYYWHLRKESVVVVPLIFTFDFFIIAFLVVMLALILIHYWYDIWQLFLSVVYFIYTANQFNR